MATTSRRGARKTPNRVLQILVVLGAGGLLGLNWIGHRSLKLNIYGFHPVEEHGRGGTREALRDLRLARDTGCGVAQESLKATGVYTAGSPSASQC